MGGGLLPPLVVNFVPQTLAGLRVGSEVIAPANPLNDSRRYLSEGSMALLVGRAGAEPEPPAPEGLSPGLSAPVGAERA